MARWLEGNLSGGHAMVWYQLGRPLSIMGRERGRPSLHCLLISEAVPFGGNSQKDHLMVRPVKWFVINDTVGVKVRHQEIGVVKVSSEADFGFRSDQGKHFGPVRSGVDDRRAT